MLPKPRWAIEKCFDDKANELQERNAWATMDQARSEQALLVCTTHNLLMLLERKLRIEEQIHNETALAKRHRLEDLEQSIRDAGRTPNPLVHSCPGIARKSLRFIRRVGNAPRTQTP